MEYDIESGKIEPGEYICSSCQLNPHSHYIRVLSITNHLLYFYFCPIDSVDLKDTEGLLNHLYGDLRYNKKKWILLFDCFHIGFNEIYYLRKLRNLYNHYQLNLDYYLLENIVLLNNTYFNNTLLSFLFSDYYTYFKEKILYDKNNNFKELIETYLD
jgi:hypothetical protein